MKVYWNGQPIGRLVSLVSGFCIANPDLAEVGQLPRINKGNRKDRMTQPGFWDLPLKDKHFEKIIGRIGRD